MRLFEETPSRKKLSGHVLWFLFWLSLTVIGVMLKPSPTGMGTHTQLGLPPCPSILFFNRPCPGCGLTTSWTRLLNGDVVGSFQAHLFGPILYAGFTLSALFCLYGFLRVKRFLSDSKEMTLLLAVVVTLFVSYGVFRFFASTGVHSYPTQASSFWHKQ